MQVKEEHINSVFTDAV